MNRASLIVAIMVAGCVGDLDPPWQLDHDRIVAVRATPPGLAPGSRATLDGLLARKGGVLSVASPETVAVVAPASLADVVARDGAGWVVTAPSEDRLAAARAELRLAAGAPVPLEIGVSYAGQTLVATKTIELGAPGDNPALVNVMIDGKPSPASEIVVGKLVNVPLSVDANDTDFDVTWLTSCGTMHDFDLPAAYLRVEAADRADGELALVVRDAHGGVAWSSWTIRAE